ncbi:hypothetical protein AURDEDRAFT_121876 [Auricularia subglabra TFB-10046 SS5]|nr:hypothetical protein AURDEDRAFT_121876 [Auricularia subglabra TFB-10046 SS5]
MLHAARRPFAPPALKPLWQRCVPGLVFGKRSILVDDDPHASTNDSAMQISIIVLESYLQLPEPCSTAGGQAPASEQTQSAGGEQSEPGGTSEPSDPQHFPLACHLNASPTTPPALVPQSHPAPHVPDSPAALTTPPRHKLGISAEDTRDEPSALGDGGEPRAHRSHPTMVHTDKPASGNIPPVDSSPSGSPSASHDLIPKPQGEVTRVKRGGYTLLSALDWDKEYYKRVQLLVQRLVATHLDTSMSYTKQDPSAVDSVCRQARPHLSSRRTWYSLDDSDLGSLVHLACCRRVKVEDEHKAYEKAFPFAVSVQLQLRDSLSELPGTQSPSHTRMIRDQLKIAFRRKERKEYEEGEENGEEQPSTATTEVALASDVRNLGLEPWNLGLRRQESRARARPHQQYHRCNEHTVLVVYVRHGIKVGMEIGLVVSIPLSGFVLSDLPSGMRRATTACEVQLPKLGEFQRICFGHCVRPGFPPVGALNGELPATRDVLGLSSFPGRGYYLVLRYDYHQAQ